METTKIVLFKNKQVRKTLHNNEWWFAVNDVIEALTDSHDPAQYFKRLKERDEELAKLTDKGVVQFVPPLMLGIKTIGGVQKAYCWHTEGIFRLIQSIPSPKAEPFNVGSRKKVELLPVGHGSNWKKNLDAPSLQRRIF